LETLLKIARREACNTFVLPGICKLEVVRRKPRKMRNPRTGESFMLPERDALRITAPRSLKLACAKVIAPAPVVAPSETSTPSDKPAAPMSAEEPTANSSAEVAEATPVEAVATPVEQPAETAAEPTPAEPAVEPAAEAAPAEPVAESVEQPAEPPPAEQTDAQEEAAAPAPIIDPNILISFRCPRCQQEVEATGDMVGFETECPTCGNPMMVPAESELGTIHAAGNNGEDDGLIRHAQTVSTREAESISPEKLKSLTIRIDVGSLGLDTPQPEEAKDEPQSEQMVSFFCSACNQEIEASRDMIGEATICPACGAPLTVPAESAANTLHDDSQEKDPKVLQAMKGRTMRIDLGDDF
jgi:DNA-directed RNA polymerase subunit RPC12/RpoP